MRFLKDEEKRTLLFLAVSLPALAASFFRLGSLPFDPAWIAIVLCGAPIVRGALVGLVTAFDVRADVLVSLALIASVVIGEVFAAGEIAFIMTLGAYLEERTVAKARAGIERLVRLTPAVARIVRGEEERLVAAEEVKVGDVLRVLAGETIAVDGAIVGGRTSIDQSVMTGESLPVDKEEGDEVYSGTVNQFGTFDMVARKVGQDSSLQRMIRLVASADAGRAKIVALADRWATWIVAAALLAAVVTWFVTGEIIRSVTVLVVFCPCALVLATPTAIMAGIGNATKHGILVRQGDALERLAQVRRIAFDKTGTLTWGRPTVTELRGLEAGLDGPALLELAAVAELRSEHPLGRAIVAEYVRRTGATPRQPEAFELSAGRGVRARHGGQEILAGNEALFAERNLPLPDELTRPAKEAEREGATVIYLARGGKAVGMIALADTLRPDSARTVEALHRTGIGTVLLTGDGRQSASHIARSAGVGDVEANCLPERKLDVIRACQAQGEPVCMVGDGINDAPALKAAHVSIAMGGVGSDIAIDAADMVLVGDDIREIPHLFRLAARTMGTIRVNLVASMALNFAAVVLAVSGLLSPVAGALVHNVGSVAVIVNSSRLLNWRGKE